MNPMSGIQLVCNCTVVMEETSSTLRKYTQKYLGIKGHDVWNLQREWGGE